MEGATPVRRRLLESVEVSHMVEIRVVVVEEVAMGVSCGVAT